MEKKIGKKDIDINNVLQYLNTTNVKSNTDNIKKEKKTDKKNIDLNNILEYLNTTNIKSNTDNIKNEKNWSHCVYPYKSNLEKSKKVEESLYSNKPKEIDTLYDLYNNNNNNNNNNMIINLNKINYIYNKKKYTKENIKYKFINLFNIICTILEIYIIDFFKEIKLNNFIKILFIIFIYLGLIFYIIILLLLKIGLITFHTIVNWFKIFNSNLFCYCFIFTILAILLFSIT